VAEGSGAAAAGGVPADAASFGCCAARAGARARRTQQSVQAVFSPTLFYMCIFWRLTDASNLEE